MTEPAVEDPLTRAEQALADVGRDPRAALGEADTVVALIPRPRTTEEIRAVALAERAAGLALRELNELGAAEARMRRAVRVADKGAAAAASAEARMSLAYVLLERGRSRQAIALCTRALEVSRGITAHRLRTIRAMALQRTGHADEALAEYAVAVRGLRQAGDTLWESRLLNNRGILLAIRGNTNRAVRDFMRARKLFLAEGRSTDAADVLYNVGYLYGMSGDIPRALESLDAAAAEWGDLDRPEYWAGRAEILTRAGLPTEASVDARRAVDILARRGWMTLEAEAQLSLAAALLGIRDPDLPSAEAAAARARHLLRRQSRPEWTAMADYLLLLARMESGRSVTVAQVERMAGRLDANRWHRHADDLRITTALRLDRLSPTAASRLLDPVTRSAAGGWQQESGTALMLSLRFEAAGDHQAAAVHLERSWRLADEAQAALGSTDLRVGAARRMRHLTDLGLRRAMLRQDPHSVFAWSERARASALRHPSARPGGDPLLREALTRWRWARAAEDEADRSERERARDMRMADAAEREVRRLVRTRAAGSSRSRPATAAAVRAALASDEAFLQLLDWRGEVWALLVDRSRVDLTRLCTAREATSIAAALRFEARRSLVSQGRARERHSEEVDRIAAALDTAVLGRLLRETDTGSSVVISPPPSLTGLPWAFLPSLSRRVTRLAPSASVWGRARARDTTTTGSTLVTIAGPGLPSAARECAGIASMHSDGVALLGGAATTSALERTLPQARVLHMATHGTLRRDNPLFSELMLADGPLCGYDVQGWASVPPVVVLSCCNAADEAPVEGDEVIGLATVMLQAGARTVVAAPVPVPDDSTTEVMTLLHKELRQDADAAAALHRCRSAAEDDKLLRLVARSFVAIGA